MADLQSKLSDLELSSTDLSELQDFDPRFIEDYLSMKDDIKAIANHVEPPPDEPNDGILRDDLLGNGDVLTAPTSNQAYILDQKTRTNAQAILDTIEILDVHQSDDTNPHATTLLNLDDILNPNYVGKAGQLPVIEPNEIDVLIRRLNALDIGFDDSDLGTGLSDLQALLELYDDQIGLRETAATGIIDGGGGSIVNDNTISINAGNGEIVDGYTDRREPDRTNISWPANPAFVINMPDIFGLQVIYADASGIVQQQPMPLSNSQRRTIVQIAFVYYRDSGAGPVIISLQPAGIHSNEVGNSLYDFIYRTSFGFRADGMGIRAVTNVLSVFADSGTFFTPGINVDNDLTDPNIIPFSAVGDVNTPMTFDVLFANGTVVPGLSAQTTIPKFWESAPNVSTALGGNDATIGYLYKTFGNAYLFQLGTNLYTNGATARDSLDIDKDQHISFVGSQYSLPSAQIYNDRTSSDFNDINKAGIVSLIGSGAGASGTIDVSRWTDLTDTLPINLIGRAGQYSKVTDDELNIDLVDLTIIDDPLPQLGGPLETQGNNVVIQSDATTEVGQLVNTVTGGVALAKTNLGVYDPNDGGIAAESGTVELHGAVANVQTLAGTTSRQVFVNAEGDLYPVEPPPPGFIVTDTDTGNYALPNVGTWVRLTGLEVTLPQDIAVGEPLDFYANIHIVELSGNRSGSVAISFGINGAQPTGPGINKVIPGGFDNLVPISFTSTTHGGLTTGALLSAWVQRASQDHNQFNVNANASVAPIHEFTVSIKGGGGSIGIVDNLLGNGDAVNALSPNMGYQLDQDKLSLDGSQDLTGRLTMNSPLPGFLWNSTSALVNDRVYNLYISGSSLRWAVENDSGTMSTNFMQVVRNQQSLDQIIFTATDINLIGTVNATELISEGSLISNGTGAAAVALTEEGGSASIVWNNGGGILNLIRLNNDGTISTNPVLGYIAPVNDYDFALKGYVDTKLSLDGSDVISGNLNVGDGTSGFGIFLRSDNITANTVLSMARMDNTAYASIQAIPNNTLRIQTFDTNGSTVLTNFTIKNDGNVSVSGPAPIGSSDLTRKNYVDGLTIRPVGAVEIGYDPNPILTGTWVLQPDPTYGISGVAVWLRTA